MKKKEEYLYTYVTKIVNIAIQQMVLSEWDWQTTT